MIARWDEITGTVFLSCLDQVYAVRSFISKYHNVFIESGLIQAHCSRLEIIGTMVKEGSTEWALYQMMQGHDMHRPCMGADDWWEFRCDKLFHFDNRPLPRITTVDWFLKNFSACEDWKIREPAPVEQPEPTHTYDITITDRDWKGLSQTWCGVPFHEADRIADALSHVSSSTTKPAYQIGDWIRTEDGDFCVKKVPTLPAHGDWNKVICRYRGKVIIKKLSPSEVNVPISIKGQIRPGFNESCFEISTPNGGWMEIGKEQISKDELELVESILKAQEEK